MTKANLAIEYRRFNLLAANNYNDTINMKFQHIKTFNKQRAGYE